MRPIVAAAFLFVVLPSVLTAQSPTPALADSARPDTSLTDTIRTTRSTTLRAVTVTGQSVSRSAYINLGSSSATKTPTLLRDIPQSVSVINRALIDDQSMQNMGDVVRYVPGVTMGQGEGNRDQPTIRGNSTTADFYINGVRDDAQYFRDLYNVESIEALKGSNAMIFGRGGGGGVINRVTKEAGWSPIGAVSLQGGSYVNRRATIDASRALTKTVAARFNGIYENSGTFRDDVSLRRHGVNPTVSIAAPDGTLIRLGYENFLDYRTADRGIPSFGNAPIATDVSTFFGNPDANFSRVRVNGGSAAVSHSFPSGLTINNETRLTSYDKMYQNILPGAVTTDGASVSLSAYNNSHRRNNIFNQTDLTYAVRTGVIAHTMLVGAEIGRERTDNFRNSGFFNDTASTLTVPVSMPTTVVPVSFRQSATDADNRVTANTRSVYAQDQVDLTDYVKLIAGLRYESFDLRFHDNRAHLNLARRDAMLSPRLGMILKPVETASLYASYSVSHLPSAGDQFSSLTNVTEGLEPEQFTNIEVGAKWDVGDRLALTTAVYQLDRTNTRAPSPADPSITVQTGSQRSRGYEIGVTGQIIDRWSIIGGVARQSALITSKTAAAATGSTVPLVPASTFSIWNKFQLSPAFSIGLGGIHQADMYAAINNTVKLPAFTRFDAGVYYTLTRDVSAQMNVENILNETYYPLANGNNNITPGSPRAVRITLTTRF